jgi:putative SOS response-associated peptidase YedK
VLPDWDYNVAPTTHQPVIRHTKEHAEREMVLMRWGMVPHSGNVLKICVSCGIDVRFHGMSECSERSYTYP